MNALAVKTPEYAALLAQTSPGVIHSEEENEHFIEAERSFPYIPESVFQIS
jgi:hypothetical protein